MATEIGSLFVNLGIRAKGFTAGLNKAKLKLQQFGNKAKLVAQKVKQSFSMIARQVKYAMIAVVGAVTLAVKAFADFQQQMAEVSTMLDDQTMRYMPQYEKQIRSMAVAFGESTKTLSKGLYDILSASIDASEAMDVLKVSSIAAKAGLTDTGVAADALTTIINSYGLKAKDAGKISDQLFAIVKKGKTTFAQLAPAIGNVASIASAAGLKWEEAGAALATMTRAGISTDESVTALRSTITAFLSPTEDAVKAAKKYGLELNAETLSTEGLVGVLGKLKHAKKEDLALIFSNVRALKGVMALQGQSAGYLEDLALQYNATGLAQEAFNKNTDTLKFTLDQAKAAFYDSRIELGEQFEPILRDRLLPALTDNTKAFAEWIEKNKEQIGLGIEKFVDTLSMAFEGLNNIVSLVIDGFGRLKVLFGWIAEKLPAMASAVDGLTNAFKKYKKEIDLISNSQATQIQSLRVQLDASSKINDEIRNRLSFMEDETKKQHILNQAALLNETIRLRTSQINELAGIKGSGPEIARLQGEITNNIKQLSQLFNQIPQEAKEAAQKANQELSTIGKPEATIADEPSREEKTKQTLSVIKEQFTEAEKIGKESVNKISVDMKEKYGEMLKGLAGSFKDAFQGIMSGAMSWKEGLLNILSDVAMHVLPMLFGMGGGSFGGGGMGGGGGGGSPLGMLSGLFGGGGMGGGAMALPFQHGGYSQIDNIPAMLNKNELVMPAPMTNWMKQALRVPQMQPAGAGVGAMSGSTTINVNAIDTQTGIEFLMKNKKTIGGINTVNNKNNHPSRRQR